MCSPPHTKPAITWYNGLARAGVARFARVQHRLHLRGNHAPDSCTPDNDADVISIHPERLIADAAELMEEFDVRHLPVLDEDSCIVGIVTDSDIREAETAGSVLSSYEPDAERQLAYCRRHHDK